MTKRKSTAKAVLSNYHALKERRYLGDLDASDTLIDFERAVKLANLTQRQSEALRLHYVNDLKQAKVAEIMGVSRNAVKHAIAESLEKLNDIYEYWAWINGEMTVDNYEEAM